MEMAILVLHPARLSPDSPLPQFNLPYSSRAWGANELTEACGQAYQDTYDNKHGMRDAHVAFWRQSALQWRNNSNVLGYELINEPFAGNPYANPTILLPGEAGRHNLQPLYDALAAAISEVDSDTLLFFEPGLAGGGGMGGGRGRDGYLHVLLPTKHHPPLPPPS